MNDLELYREQLALCDDKIIDALVERSMIIEKIMAYKEEYGMPILQPGQEVMGGVAGHDDTVCTAGFQIPEGTCHFRYRVRAVAEDGGGAVGHGGIAPDQGGHVLLVPGCIGLVQDPLVKDLGGLGSHTAQNTKALFHYLTFSIQEAYQPT